MSTEENKIARLPLLALRGLVQFTGMMLTFDVGRKKSVKAITAAMEANQRIFLVAQKDMSVDDPKADDLYRMGCVSRVRQVLKMPDGGVKVLVEGLYRAEHHEFTDRGSYLVATAVPCEDKPIKNLAIYIETMVRRIRNEFEKYAEVSSNINPEVMMTAATSGDLSFLCDFIAFSVPAPFDDKQFVLEQLSPVNRAKILLEMLSKETEITLIDNKIGEKTRHQIDENQREYYLKEQIRAISDELYGDDSADEIDEYYAKIDRLEADNSVKEKLRQEVSKLAKMPQGSHEGTVIRGWLDICLALPWEKSTDAVVDVIRAAKILDRDFYGMKKVKERILEMLSVYALAPDITGQIICLAGPPGVGKTSIGKTIAECMGREFVRISLGGMHDEAEIRGHRKTYIGSMPGRIISAIKQAGVKNPLILLDEIDKLGSDYKGDPSSALLEVLDPEQNHKFCDNFLELPFDLSHVVFITTANDKGMIPAPLLDRMEVIDLDGYTREEKFNIAKKHLTLKQIKRHALNGRNCRITDGALYGLIDYYTREAGVRKLERSIASLCSKAAKRIASHEVERVTVKETDLEKLLGKRRYRPEEILERDEVGIINGLAWTAVGGEIMQMEIAALKGSGKIELTGSLGDVMKESAVAAISFVRANAARYGIDEDFYKNNDIHIHATEAAVPKDGPSAGVTITTGLISALTGREVRRDIAMTGEVTIRGRVLPIGGLKEKSMAAYRGGVKTVFIPKENIPDLDEVDETVRANVEFIPVSYVSDIIDAALISHDEETVQRFSAPAAKEPIRAGIS
ncbi:MAG: endopeptidase La [Clostridia bacterium]|nr:endopeptidase La [Clostridia bacterium]